MQLYTMPDNQEELEMDIEAYYDFMYRMERAVHKLGTEADIDDELYDEVNDHVQKAIALIKKEWQRLSEMSGDSLEDFNNEHRTY